MWVFQIVDWYVSHGLTRFSMNSHVSVSDCRLVCVSRSNYVLNGLNYHVSVSDCRLVCVSRSN